MFDIGVDIDVGCRGGDGVCADTIYMATKLGGLLAFLCFTMMLTLLAALTMAFGVNDGNNILLLYA